MSLIAIGLIGLGLLIVLMFLRVPIALCFFFVGFGGIWLVGGLPAALHQIEAIPTRVMGTYMWTVIPLFTLMGFIANATGIVDEFYAGVRAWIGQLRGGLLHAVIVANAGFGAVCGDTISATAAFTAISAPEMRKYGYSDKLSLGSIGAGSVLSTLIPPSLTFIVFGALTETSIGKLFIGGILPGLVLTVLFIVTIVIICQINPGLAPAGPKTTWREKLKATPGMWVLVTVFIVMIGGLYMGVFTPTEAGGCTATLLLVLGLARRKLSWPGFKDALFRTCTTLGMVTFLLVSCFVFNFFVVITGLSDWVAQWLAANVTSPFVFLLIIAVITLVLGTFMNVLAMVLLMVPVLYPAALALGIDPVALCVVMTIAAGTGGLTPPYGIMILVMHRIAKDVPMYAIYLGCTPFLIPIMLCAVMVSYFPAIATWLPGLMGN